MIRVGEHIALGVPFGLLRDAVEGGDLGEVDEPAGFFEFVNPKWPESPLRLYRSAIVTLCEKMPEAMETAKRMDVACLPDETQEEVAVIHKHATSKVVLSVSTFGGTAYIWLRLYVANQEVEGETLPTTYGVRFSMADSVDKVKDFVLNHK